MISPVRSYMRSADVQLSRPDFRHQGWSDVSQARIWRGCDSVSTLFVLGPERGGVNAPARFCAYVSRFGAFHGCLIGMPPSLKTRHSCVSDRMVICQNTRVSERNDCSSKTRLNCLAESPEKLFARCGIEAKDVDGLVVVSTTGWRPPSLGMRSARTPSFRRAGPSACRSRSRLRPAGVTGPGACGPKWP